MPISSEHDDDVDELEGMDGKGLRSRLEAALADKRKLEAEVVALKAGEVLSKGGFDLVTVEDLKGVKADDLQSAAERIQKEKLDSARSVVRAQFAKQGYEGDALEEVVDGFFGGQVAGSDPAEDDVELAAFARARQVPAGAPAPIVDPRKLHGEDAIAFAFAQQEAKRSKSR